VNAHFFNFLSRIPLSVLNIHTHRWGDLGASEASFTFAISQGELSSLKNIFVDVGAASKKEVEEMGFTSVA